MPAHMALVTGVATTSQWLTTIFILIYMVIKTKRAYYKLIKLSHQKKFNNQGFANTKFWKNENIP